MNTEVSHPIPTTHLSWRADFPLAELVIVFLYILLAASWIVLSDRILFHITGDPATSLRLQTFKGVNFVLTSGALLYLVLRRSFNRRRKAERAEQQSRERFELVARASNDAIWDWDLVNDRIWWSDGFTTLFGYGSEEIEPTIESWTRRLHAEDRDRVVAGIRKVIATGGRAWADDYRFLRKDGSHAFVTDRGFVLHDEAGRPVRMVGGITDVTRQREAENAVKLSQRKLRALSARLQGLREEERARIAREVHDELGQMLTALKMDLRWIEKKLPDLDATPESGVILDRIITATELTDRTIAAVQEIAAELRPGVLDTLGLTMALKFESGRFEQRAGIRCALDLAEQPVRLAPEAATALFRIFQETLTNVARHAGATEITIRFSVTATDAVLEVSDNGRGIDPSAFTDPRSLGLLGMQERAMLLGGDIEIRTGPAGGTVVSVRVPLASNLQPAPA